MSGRRDAYAAEFHAIRTSIIERDVSCVKCGYNKHLEVHHVKGYRINDPGEMRTLCYLCHLIAPHHTGYWEWESSGIDGWNTALDHLCAEVPVDREYMRRCLTVWLDFRRSSPDFLLGARQRMKARGERCEGRKPYGHYDGEAPVLAEIRSAAVGGESAAAIARELNDRGVRTRSGGEWFPYTVGRILGRVGSGVQETEINLERR
jgi:hypothetical protein